MALSLTLIAGLLAGCIATIALPIPIVSGTGNAYTPAMALAADGTKHIVWQECPQSGGCSIYYYRTRLGEPLVTPLSFPPPVGADNRSPDIALADDGTAYIVWTTFYSSTSALNYDAYAVVNADGSASGASKLDPNTGGLLSDLTAGDPHVVARGNNVYGLYNVEQAILTTGGTFYRQLKPLDAMTGTVALDSGCGFFPTCSTVRSPKGILDSNGKLHVAYDLTTCAFLSCSDVMHQADNHAAANMSSVSLDSSSDYQQLDGSPFTAPDIAVAGDNSIFVSYSYSQTTTDAVIYATGTTFASSFVTATVPLTDAYPYIPWRVEGNVHVAAVGTGGPDRPVVAFAAKNATTGSRHEVWLFTQGDSNVTSLTNNNGDQNEPLIAMMGIPSTGVAVVGWRTWDPTFVCLRDGYEYDQLNLVVQKVFSSTYGCSSSGQSIGANANWASAVWIDYGYQGARLVPWLGFNANMTFLPVVRR
jgi:hypothetical protein